MATATIQRHEVSRDRDDVWSRLAAPIAPSAVSWRQDGKVTARDGRYFARFVCYIEANTVRERLDAVVPGEWDLSLDLLPPLPGGSEEDGNLCSFKARLQILGVIREDVGTGRDFKAAATDAFKRAAVRFGIGHELYAAEQNWVQVDGEGRWAKPLEDPALAYTRRYGALPGHVGERSGPEPSPAHRAEVQQEQRAERAAPAPSERAPSGHPGDSPSCPKCGGRMWDNRQSKRNPKAPDFKCRDRSCDGVVWPARAAAADAPGSDAGPLVDAGDDEGALDDADDLPF